MVKSYESWFFTRMVFKLWLNILWMFCLICMKLIFRNTLRAEVYLVTLRINVKKTSVNIICTRLHAAVACWHRKSNMLPGCEKSTFAHIHKVLQLFKLLLLFLWFLHWHNRHFCLPPQQLVTKLSNKGVASVYSSLTHLMFDSVESAQNALARLNGQDIYAGCCTLKIDYSKVT